MSIELPSNFLLWPEDHTDLTTEKVIEGYKQGLAGAYFDPDQKAELLATQQWPDGEQAAYDFGLVGSGEGKLSIPFLAAYKHWPKCWPCPGQTTGDCVSHGGKNSALVLIGVECELGQPDPVTGVIEGWPEVTAEAEEQGVVASEPSYGYRGHSGQGADCARLQKYFTTVGGVHLRQNYPDLNLDLTKYNASIGIRWGSGGPPENVNAEGKKHQIRACTDCETHEVARDFLANGYPIWCCSGLGWSSTKDENGYSRQSGSWSHSWIAMGYDDRDATKSKYGFPLFLYNHDWARWNSGGRRIMGTEIDIPEGAFWADARLLNRCECRAMSNLNGFPGRVINNLLI